MANPVTLLKACPACKEPNELPWFFCESCGSVRSRMGKWRTSLFLSIALMAFMGYYFLRADHQWLFLWPWPIYALFSLLFTQFAMALAHNSWPLKIRFLTWIVPFLLGAAGLFQFLKMAPENRSLLFTLPDAFVDLLTDTSLVWVTYPALAAILAALVLPAYFRWGRKYGWTNAYRILLMSVIGICAIVLAVFHLAAYFHTQNTFPALTKDLEPMLNVRPLYAEYAELGITTCFRLLVFEILVFSAVKGYSATRKIKLSTGRADLRGESGFTRAMFRIVQILRVFLFTLENMAKYTFHLLIQLSIDLWAAFLAFLREIFIPVVTMAACTLLLIQLALITEAYIVLKPASRSLLADFFDGQRWAMLGKSAAILFSSTLFLLVFVACKSRYRWSRVAVFYAEMAGWLLPNLLVFFLMLSLSLFASSATMNKYEVTDQPLPFTVGLLSKLIFIVLAGLLAFLLIRKRSLFFQPPVEVEETPKHEVENAVEDKPAAASIDPPPSRTGKIRSSLSGVFGVAREKYEQTAQSTMQKVGQDLREIMKGRPAETKELAELREQHRAKQAQLDALQSTQASISEETYRQLNVQYSRELQQIAMRLDKAQKEVNRLYETELIEKHSCDREEEQLKQQELELEALQEAGAIAPPEILRRKRQIESRRTVLKARLNRCENRLEFLTPQYRPEKAKTNQANATPPSVETGLIDDGT